MNHVPVLFLAFLADVLFELLDPLVPFFSVRWLVVLCRFGMGPHVLGRIKHVAQHDAAAGLRDRNGRLLGLRHRLGDDALRVGFSFVRRLIGPRELAHKGISAVVVEVDARHVGVVEGARAAGPLLVVASACPVKVPARSTSVRPAAAGPRKGRSLEVGLVLAAEAREQVGRGLGGELIVAQADPDRAPGQVEAVHLFQGVAGLVGIAEPAPSLATATGGGALAPLTGRIRIPGCVLAPPFAAAQTRARQTAQRHSASLAQ